MSTYHEDTPVLEQPFQRLGRRLEQQYIPRFKGSAAGAHIETPLVSDNPEQIRLLVIRFVIDFAQAPSDKRAFFQYNGFSVFNEAGEAIVSKDEFVEEAPAEEAPAAAAEEEAAPASAE